MEPSTTTTTSSPRISFSADFLDDEEEEKDFISISPGSDTEKDVEKEKVRKNVAAEFEFLSSKMNSESMITADELFFEGKLLPFWQMQQQQNCEKLSKINLKMEKEEEEEEEGQIGKSKEAAAMSWYLDDDPSPRPPKCTVLWKELLRLRKQRSSSSLSPSSSTSSSSSSGSSVCGGDESKQGSGRDKNVKMMMRVKKGGLERTRSATIRVRPVINVPICTQGKTTALPPIFNSFKKSSKLER